MGSRRGYPEGGTRHTSMDAADLATGQASRTDFSQPQATGRGKWASRRFWPVLTPLALLAIGASLLTPVGRHQWALSLIRQPTNYTTLSFNEVSALPTTTVANEAMTVSFTIGNHEGAGLRYRYILTASDGKRLQTLGQSAKIVPSGSTWTVRTVVRPACVASPCRIRVSLPGHPEAIQFQVTVKLPSTRAPDLRKGLLGAS